MHAPGAKKVEDFCGKSKNAAVPGQVTYRCPERVTVILINFVAPRGRMC